MKKNFANKLVKTVFAVAAATMLVACGNGGTDVIGEPDIVPASEETPEPVNNDVVPDEPEVQPEDPEDIGEELPDDMLETQVTCGKFDESITITEDEAYDFMTVYMSAFSSSLCGLYIDNGVEEITANPSCIQDIGSVYGIGTAISELGEGDWTYFFEGTADEVAMSLVENDMIHPEEIDIITSNGVYSNGVYCVNAYAAQKVFDEFYGEGVVDAFSYDNFEEAFSSQSGYLVTGTGIGDSGSIVFEPKEVELNGNVATLLCDMYFSYPASDEYELQGDCEITLYKDAAGVHFYSSKPLMAE